MSEATKNNAIIGYQTNYTNNAKKPPTSKDKKKTSKGNPMHIFKAALYLIKRKGDKNSKKLSPSLPPTTNATLNNWVGACRPLHLQSSIGGMSPTPPSPHPIPESRVAEVMGSPNEILFESSLYNPRHAASYSSRSTSSAGGMSSRFASALSLYDLDNHDDDEEEEIDDADAYYDGLQGDEMIDTKADMFIAQFYQQLRRQDFN